MADSALRKAVKNAQREANTRKTREDQVWKARDRLERLEWAWQGIYVTMPQAGQAIDYESWSRNLWQFCEVAKRENAAKPFLCAVSRGENERIALSLIQAGLSKGKGEIEKLLYDLSKGNDHKWMRVFNEQDLFYRVHSSATPPQVEDAPSSKRKIWTPDDALKFWTTLERVGREEWPWRILVINPEKLAKVLNTDISAVRVRVLLESMSAAALEASKAESSDFVKYMSPPYATPPGGSWRTGEKVFVRNALKLEQRHYPEFCEMHAISFSQNNGHSGWGPPLLPDNPWERIAYLLEQIPSTAWQVPSEQWRQAHEDFVLCRCFEPLQTMHPLADEQGRIPIPPDEVKLTVGALALHRPAGNRDTSGKSVSAWRAKWLFDQVRLTYDLNRLRIDNRWNWKEPNPVLRLLQHPSKENHAEALIATRAALRGQVRNCDVQGPVISPDMPTELVRDGLHGIQVCLTLALDAAIKGNAESFHRALATLFEDADEILKAPLREVDEFVRETTGTRTYQWTEAMLDEVGQIRQLAPLLQSADDKIRTYITEQLRPIRESLTKRETLLMNLGRIKTERTSQVNNLTPKGADGEPPSHKPKRKRGKDRGRQPLSTAEENQRFDIIDRWYRAKDSGVSQKEFCESQNVARNHLVKCIEWRATRKRRGQRTHPTKAVKAK